MKNFFRKEFRRNRIIRKTEKNNRLSLGGKSVITKNPVKRAGDVFSGSFQVSCFCFLRLFRLMRRFSLFSRTSAASSPSAGRRTLTA